MSIDLKKKSINNSIQEEFSAMKVLCLKNGYDDNTIKLLLDNQDVDNLIAHLDSDNCLMLKHFPYRYRRGITLWRKAPSNNQHFMHETCNTNITYMDTPVEDLYDRSLYQDRLIGSGFLFSLSNHRVIIEKPDLFAITYTESTDQNMIVDVTSIHPHCITHTVHEMFKLMLEWQWAHHELSSEEPMAIFCNEVLLSIGLDYRNEQSDPVVKGLMQLPEMYVAQFLAGNTVIKPTFHDPEEPLEYKLWASKKNIYSYKRDKYHDLYEACIRIKILENKLSQI